MSFVIVCLKNSVSVWSKESTLELKLWGVHVISSGSNLFIASLWKHHHWWKCESSSTCRSARCQIMSTRSCNYWFRVALLLRDTVWHDRRREIASAAASLLEDVTACGSRRGAPDCGRYPLCTIWSRVRQCHMLRRTIHSASNLVLKSGVFKTGSHVEGTEINACCSVPGYEHFITLGTRVLNQVRKCSPLLYT